MSDEKHDEKHDSSDPQPTQGFERSAERDANSRQVIGEHSRQVERKLGEQMPDRK